MCVYTYPLALTVTVECMFTKAKANVHTNVCSLKQKPYLRVKLNVILSLPEWDKESLYYILSETWTYNVEVCL